MVDRAVLAAKIAAVRDAGDRYGALDWRRIHQLASTRLDDLLAFCEALARRA